MPLMVVEQAIDSLRQLARFLWPADYSDPSDRNYLRQRYLQQLHERMLRLQRRQEKLRSGIDKAEQACRVQASVLNSLSASFGTGERTEASIALEKLAGDEARLLLRLQRCEQKYNCLQERYRRIKRRLTRPTA